MIRVTVATEGQLRDLIALLIEMHEDNGIFPLSLPKTIAYVRDTLDRGLILLAWQDERLVGTLALGPGETWYSESPFLEERWIFVHPDARKTTAFLRMMRFAIRVADDKGWPMVNSVITRNDIERKARVFPRLGFEDVGRVFLRPARGV